MNTPDSVEGYKARCIAFWDRVAEQHSEFTRKCLSDNEWVAKKLQALFPDRKKLRIADIGTGAGFMAISLAQLGHEVTATDISGRMLEEARKNAELYGVDVDLVMDDIEHTQLPKGSFDLVVLRDVVYNVTDTEGVSATVVDLLRPGGITDIIDGNYFLHNHDDDYNKRQEYHFLKERSAEYQKMEEMSDEDYRELEALVSDLDVNRTCRPYGDLNLLTRLGLKNLNISCDDMEDYHRLTENGWMKVPFRYTLVGQKPNTGEILNPLKNGYLDSPIPNESESSKISRIFEAMSNADRLLILSQLKDGPLSVHEIKDRVGLSEKMCSYHLTLLKDAGIVTSSKSGREVLYKATDARALVDMMRIAVSLSGQI
jgi:SAM-dependent methyltransferase/DNA-binding transcriptional ArsR family regulator